MPFRQNLPYWSTKLIWADPLHFLYLGVGRDCVRSVLGLLLRSSEFFGVGVYEARRETAYERFYNWCRSTAKQYPSCVRFEKSLIFNKAMDNKLLIGWLAEELLELEGESSDLLQTAVYCLAKCRAQCCRHCPL